MTEPVTDEELAAYAAVHVERVGPGGRYRFCADCEDAWPCFPVRLIAEIERLRAELEEAGQGRQEQGWSAGPPDFGGRSW